MTDYKLHGMGLVLAILVVLVGASIQAYSSKRELIRTVRQKGSSWWWQTQNHWLVQPDETTQILTVEADKLQLTTEEKTILLTAEPPAAGSVMHTNNQGQIAYVDLSGRITIVNTKAGTARQLNQIKSGNILGWAANSNSLIVSNYYTDTRQMVISRIGVVDGSEQKLVTTNSQSVPDQWWSLEPIKQRLIFPNCHEQICQLSQYDLASGKSKPIELRSDQGVVFEPRLTTLIFSNRFDRIFTNDTGQRLYLLYDWGGELYHSIHQYPQPENEIKWVGVDPLSFTLVFYSPLKGQVYFYDANYVHFDYLNSAPPTESVRILNYGLFTRKKENEYELVNRFGQMVDETNGLPVWWK